MSLAWAALACALVLLWQFLTVQYNRQGNWTALFLTGQAFAPPPELAAGTYRFPGGGYDGQFYRYVAHDPLFQRGLEKYMDGPVTRYRRILVPGLAFVLAVGRQPWIDGAYIVVIAFFVLLGAYWLSRWSALHGHHPAWGLAFLIVPTTLISMDRMTVDVALTALAVGATFYYETESWPYLYGVLVLAGLTRETGVLLAAGFSAVELLRRRFARSAIWASAILPTLAWYGFVHSRLPGRSDYGVPRWFLTGQYPTLFSFIVHPPRYPLPPLPEAFTRSLDAVALAAMLGAFFIAVFGVRTRLTNPLAISALLFAAVGIALIGHPTYWADCNEYARVFSPLLILIALPSLAHPRNRISVWLTALLPAILMDLRLGIQFVAPIGGVLRGLLRL